MDQVPNQSIFSRYISDRLVHCKREPATPEDFKQTLRTFVVLDRDVGLASRDSVPTSIPIIMRSQLEEMYMYLRDIIPRWRREFNHLYFSPDLLPEDQSSICIHAADEKKDCVFLQQVAALPG